MTGRQVPPSGREGGALPVGTPNAVTKSAVAVAAAFSHSGAADWADPASVLRGDA